MWDRVLRCIESRSVGLLIPRDLRKIVGDCGRLSKNKQCGQLIILANHGLLEVANAAYKQVSVHITQKCFYLCITKQCVRITGRIGYVLAYEQSLAWAFSAKNVGRCFPYTFISVPCLSLLLLLSLKHQISHSSLEISILIINLFAGISSPTATFDEGEIPSTGQRCSPSSLCRSLVQDHR